MGNENIRKQIAECIKEAREILAKEGMMDMQSHVLTLAIHIHKTKYGRC